MMPTAARSGEIRVREPVHQFGPAGGLVVHDVRVRQMCDGEQQRRGALPAGRQAAAAQVGPDGVLLAIGREQPPVPAVARRARNEPALRGRLRDLHGCSPG